MQRKALRLLGAVSLVLCAVVPVGAQDYELPVLRVELKCENCGVKPEYTLELHELRGRQKVETADLMADGTFTLRHVPYGDYQLMVTDPAGNMVHQEFITVSQIMQAITVHVTAPLRQRPPEGPVSMAQLQHPPTRKAFQAVLAAQKFSRAGNHEKAAGELQKAVALSPYYTDAYINLAAQHIRLRRYAEARDECKRALEVGGPTPLLLTNLASAQYGLKQLDDAAGSARWALRLEPGYPQAHFILGLILSVDTRTVHEGLQHLQKAAETISSAQVEVEKVQDVLTRTGM
ncbi:MAG: tetratricopeptide repeat protein [Candidatus Sulfopaludibacter sp.]|nr:tetratricopeptide repeat protein [Candidatus Sulfopaludibacter sp.]